MLAVYIALITTCHKMTVAIVSEKRFADADGSSFRPLIQSEGLKANGFTNFKLFDINSLNNLNESDYSIIHAHQRTGLQFDNYLVDLHGIFTRQFEDAITRYSFIKREALRLLKLHSIEKMQNLLLKRAKGIICAGESIEEYVKAFGTTYLVRNCVKLNSYEDCYYSSTKVCVCGPFLKTYQNYHQLKYVLAVAKKLPKISLVLIGKIEVEDQDILNRFSNVKMLGYVNDFVEQLRDCSILFAPYPFYSSQGGAKTKLIEAGACGMPIVASPYATCDFRSDDAWVGTDTKKLMEGLLYFSESESNRKYVGQKIKSAISEYHNYLVETKKLIQVYKEMKG